jgi:hypothetical protein
MTHHCSDKTHRQTSIAVPETLGATVVEAMTAVVRRAAARAIPAGAADAT